MTMAVLTMVYGAVAIDNDFANLKKIYPIEGLHYFYFNSYIAVILLLDSLGVKIKNDKKNVCKNII